MDFYKIKEREGPQKKSILEIYPDFRVMRSSDLMVRGKQFHAIWDEEAGLWSTDEYRVQQLVDADIRDHQIYTEGIFDVVRKYLGDFSTHSWMQFRNYISNLADNSHDLDTSLTFANTEVKKTDYVSKRLPYSLAEGDHSAFDEILDKLYPPEEQAKILWVIGALITGDSKTIQKFVAFYGAPGTGKSTIMNIIEWLMEGYVSTFTAKELTGPNNSFALESFKNMPLLSLDHDADLSRIQDNSKMNALVAHEPQEINEKNKPKYMARFPTMLMVGTNSVVRITDSKSGIIRRLLDIHPTGDTFAPRRYHTLMTQVKFELGAIAWYARETYLSMGKNYYAGYKPIQMMLGSDIFFNYIEANYDLFREQDGVSLNQAFILYKEFIKESDIEHSLPRYKLREELKSYFENFDERPMINGERMRNYYSGFKADKFKVQTGKVEPQNAFTLVLEETESLFDKAYSNCVAQYSRDNGHPEKYWDGGEKQRNGEVYIPKASEIVSTKLKDLDTSREHFVKVPESHIVIDFDLTDETGKKSAERNLEVASTWSPTYAEFSKSGAGIHLHYNYTGDPTELARVFDDGIEVKVFSGNSSLRRRLSYCNAVPIAEISSGLPLKEKKVIDEDVINGEKHIRALINKAIRKGFDNIVGTKSNVDFINEILNRAYSSGQSYNVSDMRGRVLTFASMSSNQALLALKIVQGMKFASEDAIETIQASEAPDTFKSQKSIDAAEKEVYFDVEVFSNLFVVCWKYRGSDNVVSMVNPSAQEIEKLLGMKLVGFFNRQYDNHIIYAAYMGYNNAELYALSQRLIGNDYTAKFGKAYDLSYADIYDVASIKMSLKKWEIELGIHHLELSIPWDKPVSKELIPNVIRYCENDVRATEAVREHLNADFIAREILADLSGLPINATTQQHTSKIIFGEDRKPQEKFVYTDLSEMFPGYKFELGKKELPNGKVVNTMLSTYRGEETGEGGYVYSEPGMYENVVVLDVASMHPTSIEALDLFGEYTENFAALKAARIAIKRKDYDAAKEMLGGKLARHLNDPAQAKALSYALKIVINIVYGLTSAKFDNAFRDPRNIDNIVAKRGALFMINLKYEVQERGFQVVHIKTDSIKIPNATPEIIKFVHEYGEQFGYEFEHEETLAKFCLVNKAVYIGKIGWHATEPEKVGTWEATGAQFQQPYVFKTLFSGEEIVFNDLCETKTVTTAMYIDYTGLDDTPMAFSDDLENNMKFVGKAGRFTPMQPGTGGGVLVREKDGRFSAATGSTGYFWMESEMVKSLKKEHDIDKSYFTKQVDKAVETISEYGDFEWFIA